MTSHNRDSDCTVVNDICAVCGVAHGDPCETCGGEGFHKDSCAESEERSLAAKFPVGARVRIIRSDLGVYVGLTGTVLDYDLSSFPDEPSHIGVSFDTPVARPDLLPFTARALRDGFYDDELVLLDAPAAESNEDARLLAEKKKAYAAFMASIDASNAAQNNVMRMRDAYLAAATRADKMR